MSGLFSTYLLSRQSHLIAMQESGTLSSPIRTGYFNHPAFLQHHIDNKHPESPERIAFIQKEIMDSGLVHKLVIANFDTNPEKYLQLVHSKEHILSIKSNTPIAHKVALAGVGASIAAVEQVATNKVNNAFCASRPPGHHAMNSGREEGFCYYNNVAIATRFAQQYYGLNKILIIDWDYHHGNATELTFYDDPNVLFFSTHDQYAYPGTGNPNRKGKGDGLGFNINVHLPCGTNDEKIVNAFERILIPAADKFKPDLVLISAGFDSRKDDLLGCFDVTDSGYEALTMIARKIAERHCDGRLISVLEGGYNLKGIAKAVVAHVSVLLNMKTG
ncbi:MAG: acetoin utilization deacetylase AcuC-like enzyme [Gammaproteobacteria bacterium]